ncbi:MAG: YdcF family protein [Solobacterium sp.]|nr:YdcF family protein [Solobacterium sp.]
MKNSKEFTAIKCWACLALSVLFLCSIGLHYSGPGGWTGLVLSVWGFLIHLYPDQWADWKEQMRTNHSSLFRALKIIGYTCLVLAVVCSALITTGLFESLPQEKDVTVIICGSGVNHDGTVSLIGTTRINAVLDWLKEHPDVPVVVSGGNYSADLPSEAESMKNHLIEEGIAEERIYPEPASMNTRENLSCSAELIRANHLPETVLIATSEFHEYRCGLYAKRNNLTPYRKPGRTPWYLLPTCWIRECYGILLAHTLTR